MSAEPQQEWTFEEYLAHDRESEVRYEYLDGQIFAMSGASRKHNLVNSNIQAALHPQVRGHGCEIYVCDMRVRIPAADLGTYPDIVVVCGEPEFEGEKEDVLTNPTLLVEVLSPSTEDYDHGKKFAHYRTLPSLASYLMFAQDEVHVELFERQAANRWAFSELRSLEDVLDLPVIESRLALADVYAAVPGIG
ncbi:MAG: Uma2 family endonuclease [bacterium]|nr:Uma2 family endonuclease [bacterium]